MDLQNLQKGVSKLGPVIGDLPQLLFRAYKLGNDIIKSASPQHKAEFANLNNAFKAISRKIQIILEREDVISCLKSHEYESDNEQLWTHSDLPTVILLEDTIIFNNKAIRFSEWTLNCEIEEYGENNA